MKNANITLIAVAALGFVVGLGRAAEVAAPAEAMSVWFVSPAKSFHESCPRCPEPGKSAKFAAFVCVEAS